jgi:hypothetical protein
MAIEGDYFCSTLSLASSEPLYGSAPEKRVWMLLEYNRSWGAQAFPESDLPAAVKGHISGYLESIPASNILMIRQPGRREGIRFFVALADEHDPRLYEFALNDYTNIPDVDIAAVVRGDSAYDSQRTSEPLYLVCTNARRDKCCAKYGIGLYAALQAYVGERAWQCSHIGGHRFAPTSLFLPHGLCYGRIDPSHIGAMVSAHREGRITLDYLRGRVCYDAPVQAADYLLRQQLGLSGFADLRLIAAAEAEPGMWMMQFAENGRTHHIRLQKITTDVAIYTSCANDKQALVEDYRLI